MLDLISKIYIYKQQHVIEHLENQKCDYHQHNHQHNNIFL